MSFQTANAAPQSLHNVFSGFPKKWTRMTSDILRVAPQSCETLSFMCIAAWMYHDSDYGEELFLIVRCLMTRSHNFDVLTYSSNLFYRTQAALMCLKSESGCYCQKTTIRQLTYHQGMISCRWSMTQILILFIVKQVLLWKNLKHSCTRWVLWQRMVSWRSSKLHAIVS